MHAGILLLIEYFYTVVIRIIYSTTSVVSQTKQKNKYNKCCTNLTMSANWRAVGLLLEQQANVSSIVTVCEYIIQLAFFHLFAFHTFVGSWSGAHIPFMKPTHPLVHPDERSSHTYLDCPRLTDSSEIWTMKMYATIISLMLVLTQQLHCALKPGIPKALP